MNDSSAQTDGPNAGSRYTVIARRYRPQTFDELVGQEHVARALQQAIASDRVGHAYLFTGARGTGKTSAARIFAKALNCVHGPTPTPCNECDVCEAVSTGDDVDVLEIDGASNNGVDEVRELRQNASVRPSRTRFKVYIIDEVHMLSKSAFNALLKTLEEPPEHVKFIFATTEAHKIPITILSRCQRFDFAGISPGAIQGRLSQIAKTEGVDIEPAALQILASRAAGSMRDSQSLLEQLLAVGRERITAADVNELLGIAPAERLNGLVRNLAARDAAAALKELDATIQGGVDVGLLLDQLVGYFRDVMAASVGCSADQLLYALPTQAEEVAEIGRQLGLPTILAISQILDQTSARMRVSTHGRTLVEMAVVRICQLGEMDDLAALVAELRGDEAPASSGAPRVADAKKNGEAAPQSLTAAVSAALREPREDAKPAVELPAEATTPAAATQWPTAAEPSRAQHAPPTEPVTRRTDPPHSMEDAAPAIAAETPIAATAKQDAPVESVLSQWQKALAEGNTSRATAPPPPPRQSKRERLAEVAEQPFVRRAMELFDAPADRMRYMPPGEGKSGVVE